MTRKTELVAFRVDAETKRLLEQLAKQDGHGVSELLRDYARDHLEAARRADEDAKRIIREEVGGERAVKMVREMSIRPSQYLAAWRLTHPPEPTAEERRAAELQMAEAMGLTPEQYDAGRRDEQG